MDSGECLVKKTVRMRINLDPTYLGDVAVGVREHLNKHLRKYSQTLGGVPTQVVSAQLEQSSGAIVGDAPGVQCAARATYLVFTPQPGELLVGDVNAISSDHIGLLIANNWNASIPRSYIPEQYEYDHELERWCDRDFDSPLIEVGSTVSFTFQEFEMGHGGTFSVIGSLEAANTGLIKKDAKKKKSAKKRRAEDGEANGHTSSNVTKKRKKQPMDKGAAATHAATSMGQDALAEEGSTSGALKKKKKKQRKDRPVDTGMVNTSVGEPGKSKKKKKSKEKSRD
eukprot:m.180618 g.180618  ORF g.180618 m.180618 type:complete len:283 (-) comp15048_c0_seq1:104-952(-)